APSGNPRESAASARRFPPSESATRPCRHSGRHSCPCPAGSTVPATHAPLHCVRDTDRLSADGGSSTAASHPATWTARNRRTPSPATVPSRESARQGFLQRTLPHGALLRLSCSRFPRARCATYDRGYRVTHSLKLDSRAAVVK